MQPLSVARLYGRAAGAGLSPSPMRFFVPGLSVLLAVAGPALPRLHAQEVSPAVRPSFVDVAWPGAAMGAGGFLVGGLAGIAIADCPGTENDGICALEGAFFGAGVLGTIGLATGVHLGNDRRGSYALDLVTAGGIWGLTIGVLAANDWPDTATTVAFVTLPIAQMIATVAVERATGDRAATDRRARELKVGLAPGADGGFVVAGRLRF